MRWTRLLLAAFLLLGVAEGQTNVSFQPYGTGCYAPNALLSGTYDSQTRTAQWTALLPGTGPTFPPYRIDSVFFVFGTQQVSFPLGGPCTLLTNLDLATVRVPIASAGAPVTLSIVLPQSPALIGATFNSQGIPRNFSPFCPCFTYLATNGLQVAIQ